MRFQGLMRFSLTATVILGWVFPTHARQEHAAPIENAPTVAGPAPAEAAGLGDGLRAATLQKLASLQANSTDSTTRPISSESRKALVDLLQARIKTLGALEHSTAARERAEHPTNSPGREKTELEEELKGLELQERSAELHLPESFAPDKSRPVSAQLDAMRDAISAAKESLRETVDELESLRSELHQKTDGGRLSELKTRREDLHQKFEELTASRAAAETEASDATSPEARQIAKEKTVNIGLEVRLVDEELHTMEALIAQEAEHVRLADLRMKTQSLRQTVGQRCLHVMQARYQELSDRRHRELEAAANASQQQAERLKDPIEHFRARRGALLFALQATLLNEEKALSATPAISAHEQERLIREATEDLANLKALIEGGRSTTLVALRLTNSYRRIAKQREAIVGHELAKATAILTYYENLLTAVELDILNDSREERQEFEALLSQLPPSRHRLARDTFEQLEDQHRGLLESRRMVLGTLANHAEKTRSAILRRIAILDDQYAYIRTHIFWVRDTQPIGLATYRQCRQEVRSIFPALAGIAWTRWKGQETPIVSVEFVLVGTLALVLPIILLRVRHMLNGRLAREYGRAATSSLRGA